MPSGDFPQTFHISSCLGAGEMKMRPLFIAVCGLCLLAGLVLFQGATAADEVHVYLPVAMSNSNTGPSTPERTPTTTSTTTPTTTPTPTQTQGPIKIAFMGLVTNEFANDTLTIA